MEPIKAPQEDHMSSSDSLDDQGCCRTGSALQEPKNLQELNLELSNTIEELQVLEEELRQQNEELAQSRLAIEAERQRYWELFEEAPDGYLVTDHNGVIQRANQAAVVMLGELHEDKLLGRPLRMYLPEQDWRSFSEFMTHLKREGSLRDCELHMGPWRGRSLTVAVNATVMREGSVALLRWLIRDISDRKAMEAELRRSNQELQEFAFVASHDLHEPLRKVSAFGQRIKAKYADQLGEEGLDFLSRMLGATERMRGLLDALLDYSRVGTRMQPFTRLDLESIVRSVLDDLETLIELSQGQVTIENLPAIDADPSQMRQLFQNLIGNALKFRREERPTVKIYSVGSPEGQCRIYIEDNGIGFDEEYAEQIFAPFQRLHGRSAYEGAGMGLAICRKIVERHGGTITAQSTPGQGSTFIVTLPLRQSQPND